MSAPLSKGDRSALAGGAGETGGAGGPVSVSVQTMTEDEKVQTDQVNVVVDLESAVAAAEAASDNDITMTQVTSSGAASSSEGEAKSSAKLTPLQEVAMEALRLDEFKKTVLSQLIVGDFPKPETQEEFEAQRSVVNACTTQWAGLKGWGAKWATEHTGEGVDVPLPTDDAPIRWGDLTDFHGATTDGLVHRAWRGVAATGLVNIPEEIFAQAKWEAAIPVKDWRSLPSCATICGAMHFETTKDGCFRVNAGADRPLPSDENKAILRANIDRAKQLVAPEHQHVVGVALTEILLGDKNACSLGKPNKKGIRGNPGTFAAIFSEQQHSDENVSAAQHILRGLHEEKVRKKLQDPKKELSVEVPEAVWGNAGTVEAISRLFQNDGTRMILDPHAETFCIKMQTVHEIALDASDVLSIDIEGEFNITMLTEICKVALEEEAPVSDEARIVAFMPNGKDRKTNAPRFTAVLVSPAKRTLRQHMEMQVARKHHVLCEYFKTAEFGEMKASLKRKREHNDEEAGAKKAKSEK